MSPERAKSDSDGCSPSNKMVLKSRRDENIVARVLTPGKWEIGKSVRAKALKRLN
jgi:hypothetical protein